MSLQGPSCDQSLRARVVDGDTIDAIMGQRAETSRYIGVNTLRRATPRVGEEPGGRAASELNHGLVSGKTVELRTGRPDARRYGRLLAYAYVEDLMVNAEVARRGYAQVMTIPPNVRHQELFVKLQREAREQKRGLWAEASMAESVPAPVVPQRQSPEDGQAWLPRLRGRAPANYP